MPKPFEAQLLLAYTIATITAHAPGQQLSKFCLVRAPCLISSALNQ